MIVSALRLAFIAALAFAPIGASAADKVVMHRSNGAEPDSLDPHKSSGTWENNIIGDMILGLMTENAKGETIYGAAESHKMSADGRVYTFQIRKDMTWSDGVPVTADDFVFALERILDPKTAAQYASILYPIKNAAAINQGRLPPVNIGARAIDAKTLEVTLENPTPYFLELLTHYTAFPVPKHKVAQLGDDWVKAGNYVSNGAYMLADWVPNSQVRLVRNPKFYDAANVKIDEVVFYPISDSSIALKRFRAGELHATNDFPTREYQKLKSGGYPEIKPSEVRVAPYTATSYIQFNTTKAPFNDARVRRALSLALDRETITDKVLGTGQVPAYALVPPGMANYGQGPELDFKGKPFAERQAEAKALLAEAGFTAANPLKFQYRYRENLDNRRIAIAVAAMWKEIGVSAELFNAETKVHYNALRTQDFEVADAGWVADYNDAENYLFLLQSTSGQMNYGKYANPAYDALMAKAAATTNLEARAAILRDAERIILGEQPLVPLFFSVSRSLVRSNVEGWEDNLLNWHRTRFMRIAAP